jgi:hypothetical protein
MVDLAILYSGVIGDDSWDFSWRIAQSSALEM